MFRRPVRRGRPGLVGTMAQTAVIAGTATAVSGSVANRQHAKAAAQQQAAAADQATIENQQQLAEMQAQVAAMQAQQDEASRRSDRAWFSTYRRTLKSWRAWQRHALTTDRRAFERHPLSLPAHRWPFAFRLPGGRTGWGSGPWGGIHHPVELGPDESRCCGCDCRARCGCGTQSARCDRC